MIRLKSAVIIAMFPLLILSPAAAKEPIRTLEGIVSKVSDGDTIHIKDSSGGEIRVRLYGIDAPEIKKSNHKTGKISNPGQPFGQEALDVLKEKIAGKQIKIEVIETDLRQRPVSVVKLGDRDINCEMIREGLAWAYRQYLHRPYKSEYIAAEEGARKEKLGLWQQDNPEPPWEFRKLQKNLKK